MNNGQWKRAGPFETLVNPRSAIQRGTKEDLQHPVDKDHSNLVKFAENDDDLGAILYFMQPLYNDLKRLQHMRYPSQQHATLSNHTVNGTLGQYRNEMEDSQDNLKFSSTVAQKEAMRM